MNILYQDEFLVVVEKLSGMHIHPPEDKRVRVPRSHILLYQLREYLNTMVYPVHRLDAGTSGVLLMGLSSKIASNLCLQFQNNEVKKKYTAVVRGFVADSGLIDRPLKIESSGKFVTAETYYKCSSHLELDFSVDLKFLKSRFSLVEVHPYTGRYHQIRRHFNGIAHPIIGDSNHGDSRYNQFFRETMGISGLCLRATELTFNHPEKNERMTLVAPMDEKWKCIQNLFKQK